MQLSHAPDAQHYDSLYRAEYMAGFDDVYEYCRARAVASVLPAVGKRIRPRRILDVGCGQGRYTGLLRSYFPKMEYVGIDFSEVAVAKAREKYPSLTFSVGLAESLGTIPDMSFDMVISIEVLEHVVDAHRVVGEFARVLRPGGGVLLTTPCANRFSLEWFENLMAGGVAGSADGYQKFRTDPPEHVRRFTEKQLSSLLRRARLEREWVRYRGHFFTRPCYLVHRLIGRWLPLLGEVAYLDWRLFRRLPNGATMIGLWIKDGTSGR